ncbi:hypothetical protein HMPREF9722_00854 [Treponema denticola ATCC 33520]|uniref:formylglycine-generating enzyme family protein n=1 Tax=Treponema denticola TaxID=158 RepID=UPI0002B56E93|nr:formylglycine-generating enzyme family protein [Treponema denticola]EMB42022.1 hypothetical protein HMPREF9722_00854 [Treponema denticola ATCC 33520]
MTKSDLYSKTRAAVLIAAALFALLFTACPNNAGGGGNFPTVNITVKGDTKVNPLTEPISVWAGAKWRNVKTQVEGKVSFKPGFILNSWHLGEDESAPELTDEDAFYTDTTVFVKSRADLPPLGPLQNGTNKVKITFAVNPAEAGQILGPNPISVNKGTTWTQLEAYAKAALKANYGFSEEHVEWKKDGSVLGSTDSFNTDVKLTAHPEDRRIIVTVTGDTEVTIAEPATITVIDGAKWQDVRAKALGKVTVKNTNFAIAAWKLDGESGTVLTDDYEFKKNDGTSRTVYAETGDRRITLTVKYGRGFDATKNGGTITVYDGDTWRSVKAEAAKKVNIPKGIILQEWRRNDASGEIIKDGYIFRASDGNSRTFFARIRADIKLKDNKLTYYAMVNGDVTEYVYWLCSIPEVKGGLIGRDYNVSNKERPIYLSAYWMGKTEVPQVLYELVMGKNPSYHQGDSHLPAEGERQELRPVEKVSWLDCIAFCNELTRCTEGLGEGQCVYTYNNKPYTVQDAKDKRIPYILPWARKGFCLPTDEEWEWAAQGGSRRQKYSGTNDVNGLNSYAWYRENSESKTHEVQTKFSNDYGLHDMSGNVAEWCWNRYGNTLPESRRIIRGGCFADSESSCTCDARTTEKDYDIRDIFYGFRIVFHP